MTGGRALEHEHEHEEDRIAALRIDLHELREQVNKLRLWQAYVLGAASAIGALISAAMMIASKIWK